MADLTVKTNTPITTTTSSNPLATTNTIVAKPPVAPVTTNLVPMANAPKTDNMGLKIETKTPKVEPPKQEPPKNIPHKSKRTIDQAMRISYPDWDKLSLEQKQKRIIAHVTTVDKSKFNYLATKTQPDGRIGWLKSFLLNDKMSPQESKLLVGSLKQLNVSKAEFAELQAQGVNMAFDGDNINKESCQLQVTEDMSFYGVKAQKVAIDKTSTSEFESVKIGGSKNASKVDRQLQTYAVEKYIEGSKTSSEKTQSIIGHSIVDQYSDFAKENQVKVHEIVSTKSNLSEVVEYAASNIWHFDKENQAPAVKITTNTGNEKAINAAAANYSKYDQSARAQIKETIYNSGYDSAKNTLTEAEQAEIEQESETSSEETEKKSSNEIKDIMNSGALNKNELIKESFKNATPAEKAAWLDSLSPNELSNIINILPINTLSSDILSKVFKLMNSADAKGQKEFVAKVNATSLTNIIGTRMGFLGSAIQSIYVQDAAKKGKLGSISKDMLSLGVRQDYKKLLNEQNKGQNNEQNIG